MLSATNTAALCLLRTVKGTPPNHAAASHHRSMPLSSPHGVRRRWRPRLLLLCHASPKEQGKKLVDALLRPTLPERIGKREKGKGNALLLGECRHVGPPPNTAASARLLRTGEGAQAADARRCVHQPTRVIKMCVQRPEPKAGRYLPVERPGVAFATTRARECGAPISSYDVVSESRRMKDDNERGSSNESREALMFVDTKPIACITYLRTDMRNSVAILVRSSSSCVF
nr:hypothetical protein Iba_chr12aCG13110 [Ipomoea batatas]